MLNENKMKEQFQLLTNLPNEELDKWLHLLDNAENQVLSSLKNEIVPMEHENRLICTIAAVAYADYLLLDSSASGNMEQIKIGDISLKEVRSNGNKQQNSSSIREYFLNQIADLCLPATGIFPIVYSS